MTLSPRPAARLLAWSLLAALLPAVAARGEAVLRNDAYELAADADGAVRVTARDGGMTAVFRPKFVAIYQAGPLAPTPVKWQQPAYNLTGWKLADGTVVRDVFRAGERVELRQPAVARADGGGVRWRFADERLDVEAEWSLPPGGAEPRLR